MSSALCKVNSVSNFSGFPVDISPNQVGERDRLQFLKSTAKLAGPIQLIYEKRKGIVDGSTQK